MGQSPGETKGQLPDVLSQCSITGVLGTYSGTAAGGKCCQPVKFPGALVSRGSVAKAQSHSALMREDISECQSSSPGTGQGPVLKTSLP